MGRRAAMKLARGIYALLACAACGSDLASLDGGVPVDAPPGLPDAGPPHPGPVCGLALTMGEGGFILQSCDPAWTFGGTFPAAISGLKISTGTDPLGKYLEAAFNFTTGSAHRGTIRVYADTPVAQFSLEY